MKCKFAKFVTLGLSALVVAQAAAAPSTFSVSANGHYWLKNGSPFIPLGYNRYDIWNPNDPANDGLTVAQYVQRMAANGCNVIRIWAEQGDQNATGEFYLERPSGTFQPAQVARLDALFDACDLYGVSVMVCPWDTYNIKNNWSVHPYNRVNGGPCGTPAEVVSNVVCRGLIKDKLQFMANRWGSRPSFFLWTFNEIDILNTSDADQQAFCRDIGGYLDAIDPSHPFTISWTGSGAGNPNVVRLATDDAADIHFYGAISGVGAVAKIKETATLRDGGYMNFGKPLVLSEWGVNRAANSDDLVNAESWGAIAIGTAGAAMPWTDKYTYGAITASQLAIYKNLGAFVNSVNWGGFMDNRTASSTDITDSASAVTPYGCLNKSQAIVLLVGSRVGTSTATTVTVNGLNPGTYTVDFWKTYAGGKHSTVTATANAQGKLVVTAPAVPTMQCLYIR
jgi:mannan endo-1,4-beta-mannosidase